MIYEMDWNTWLKLGGHKRFKVQYVLLMKVTLKQMIEHINNVVHI